MALLPDYVAAAKPVPRDARAAWYRNTAQTYAGIMLWVVFWRFMISDSPAFGGSLAAGLGVALVGLLLAALFCHFLTYLVPALLGMKTGLPLYVVGTSTYGVRGGFIMPGFLMGLLQFGWLAVNAAIACALICECFQIPGGVDEVTGKAVPGLVFGAMNVVYILLAVFVGLMGIKYVARVATWIPLIPLAILAILLIKTMGGLGDGKFDNVKLIVANADKVVADKAKAAEKAADKASKAETEAQKADLTKKAEEAAKEAADANVAAEATKNWVEAPDGQEYPHKKKYLGGLFSLPNTGATFVLLFLSVYVVGFFATAGAAGTDFGMNNRHGTDVQVGGLVGIVGATFFAGGVAMLVVAGAYGAGMVTPKNMGELDPVYLMPDIVGGGAFLGLTADAWMRFLLALACFAPACFPAFIAANSFRTTLSKVNPWISVGLGTLASMALAVSGWALDVVPFFKIVGASFGPICGAMMADYLLAGRKWGGPRAGFNPAGWISWAAGFYVGAVDLAADKIPGLDGLYVGIPCPPMAALIVGFVLYLVLAKLGLQSKSLASPEPAQ